LLGQFPAVLNAVRGLMGKKPLGAVGLPDVRDPIASIAALKPVLALRN
jgi:hypothetical protein